MTCFLTSLWFLVVCMLAGCTWDPYPDGGGPCEGLDCDDGNECTHDGCSDGQCESTPHLDGTECTFNGTSGVCVSGVCGENVCEGVVCDDVNECTAGTCDYADGSCTFTPIADGKACGAGGYCQGGMCEVLVDQCTGTDLEAIDAGDEPDPKALADCTWMTAPSVDPSEVDVLACLTDMTECLEDAGTSLTLDCSSCFALQGCCVITECSPLAGGPCTSNDLPESGEDCDTCIQESCQTRVDICVGGQ